MRHFYFLPTALFFCLVSAASALELFESAKPQSTKDTCQSYAPILALAALSDPAFPIDDFSQLRVLEQEFRRILKEVSKGKTTHHIYWARTMEQLTGGVYTLDIKYEPDTVEYIRRLRNETTLSSDVSSLVGQRSGTPFKTTMTSVLAFDSSQYKFGHIITVLGVKGNGVNSQTQIIAFNSAIQADTGSVKQCPTDFQPGDVRYTAGVISSNSFVPKKFGDGYLVMTLKRK